MLVGLAQATHEMVGCFRGTGCEDQWGHVASTHVAGGLQMHYFQGQGLLSAKSVSIAWRQCEAYRRARGLQLRL